jgi:hypothetical protein
VVISPSCISVSSSARSHLPWVGWSSGVSPIHHSAIPPAQAHETRALTHLCAPEDSIVRLGFPPDFVGSHSFPHCAALLSRLWSLLVSSRSSFHGGWCITSLRPSVVEEEWSRLGSGGFRGSPLPAVMDPKNKNPQNPQWDRWGPRENTQGPQSWNRNRNLSWRLKPAPGKSEHHEGLMSSSSGEG